MKSRRVIIVGGGASGLVAAISAARNGTNVTIIEQKDRIGKKILSTGNGRCNLTNEYMDVQCFRGDDTTIVANVLEKFGYQETISFFEELGVILKNRQGYIYPISDQATTILDVLRMEIANLHVEVIVEERVDTIDKTKKGFSVRTNNKVYRSDVVILATGGKAASVLGSDGSGYHLAKAFGHSISSVVPALVQLRAKGSFFKQLAGIRTNANVSLFVNGNLEASDEGELQLTNYGISGIPVFQISRFAGKALQRKKEVTVEVDFLPAFTDEKLTEFFIQRNNLHGMKTAEDFLIGMLNKKLIPVILKESGIPCSKIYKELTEKQKSSLVQTIKHFHIEIEATNDFEQAQVCAGGVRTTEVNHETLESLYVEGLYLTGELLDVDGICGGYNLQWAWATGYLAGLHAAKG